jgi:hypothetical protein
MKIAIALPAAINLRYRRDQQTAVFADKILKRQMRSQMIAMPCPPPMHAVAKP